MRKRTAVARLKQAKSAISIGDLKYKRCLVLAIEFHVVIPHPCAPFTPFPSSRSTQGSTTAPSPRFIPQSLAAMKTHCTSDTKGFRVFFFFLFFASVVIFMSSQHLKCVQLCVCVCVRVANRVAQDYRGYGRESLSCRVQPFPRHLSVKHPRSTTATVRP